MHSGTVCSFLGLETILNYYYQAGDRQMRIYRGRPYSLHLARIRTIVYVGLECSLITIRATEPLDLARFHERLAPQSCIL
mgnify:CR=1 FL=1